MFLELTVPLEDNFEQVQKPNVKRYKDLIEESKEQEWKIEFHHVDCRGFFVMEKCVLSLLERRFGYRQKENKKITA